MKTYFTAMGIALIVLGVRFMWAPNPIDCNPIIERLTGIASAGMVYAGIATLVFGWRKELKKLADRLNAFLQED